MCDLCDRTVQLITQTKGINSGEFTYVGFRFPGGEPELVKVRLRGLAAFRTGLPSLRHGE